MKKKKRLRLKTDITKVDLMNLKQAHEFTPGVYIINKNNIEWGMGRVQSSINEIVTINFEHVGKKVINIKKVSLNTIEFK